MKQFAKRNKKITQNIVNKFFWVHNGKNFFCILITKEILNHKLGEFIFTRILFKLCIT